MQKTTDDSHPESNRKSAKNIAYLYPSKAETTLDLRRNKTLNKCFDELVSVKEEIKLLEQYEAKLKYKLQKRMGSHTKALLVNGTINWKYCKDNTVLNVSQLLIDQPELMVAYSETVPGVRRFTVQQ